MAAVRAWRLTGRTGRTGTTATTVPALVDIGLACCTLEFEAAVLALAASGVGPEATTVEQLPPGTPQLVIVSGTVTDRLAPAVLAVVELCRAVGPVRLVAFGACATSGGPYWDSYVVTNGIDQLVEVAESVPGCPPPPEALLDLIDAWVATLDAVPA